MEFTFDFVHFNVDTMSVHSETVKSNKYTNIQTRSAKIVTIRGWDVTISALTRLGESRDAKSSATEQEKLLYWSAMSDTWIKEEYKEGHLLGAC